VDCLVNFAGEIVIVGDCSGWVGDKVCLHCCYLLYETIVVTESHNWNASECVIM